MPEPSPGYRGKLLDGNWLAAWFWSKWEFMGDRAFDWFPLDFDDVDERVFFLDQLEVLRTAHAEFKAERRASEGK